MKKRIQLYCMSFLLCGAISSAHAAQGKVVPVKPADLDGTRLLLKDAKCSVDLPGQGWKWMTVDDSPHTFFCINAASGTQFLVAIGALHMEFSDHQPQSLIANAKAAITKRGGKITNDKYEWIDVPGSQKTMRATFEETEASGVRTLVVIYIANTTDKVTLKLQYTGSANAEPEELKKLVRSIRELK